MTGQPCQYQNVIR